MGGLAIRLDQEIRPQTMPGQHAGGRIHSRQMPKQCTEFPYPNCGIAVGHPAIEETAKEDLHFPRSDIMLGGAAGASRRHIAWLGCKQPIALDALIDEKVEHEIWPQGEGIAVDHHQDAEWDVIVPKHLDAGADVGVGPPPGHMTALAIVEERWTVQADAHRKAIASEETGPLLVESRGVGLHRVEDRLACPLKPRLRMYCFLEEYSVEQRRLTAMPDEFHAVVQRVLQDLPSHRRHDRKGHDLVVTCTPIIAIAAA